MPDSAPIHDLAGLALEATSLDRARGFYCDLFGFAIAEEREGDGVLEFALPSGQRLAFWVPLTRRASEPRLAKVGARGGTHVHFAMQIPRGQLGRAADILGANSVPHRQIELGPGDFGLYFFDPFGHGLELREVETGPADPRRPRVPPGPPPGDGYLPVVGLREVALAFADFEGMKARLSALGFCFVEEMEERAFAQFVLGPGPERDGQFTPRRWLYAWDPQVGLADMLGGEHATVRLLADPDAVQRRAEALGLPHLRDARGLAVRDPEGHVFEFVEALG